MELSDQAFEAIAKYCYSYSDLIPLSFVLGFYVSIVMTRWWNQYTSIPWPDPIAVFVSANVHGQDERGRVMRRTIMRYVCLCLTMVLSSVSPRVKKRFPQLSNFVDAGLLNDNEKAIVESMNKSFPRHSKHWLPIVWATSIITRARKEGRIRDDFAVKTIIDELNKFRGQCGLLISYDTISVPLVYTQVVTLAVYSYFLCCIMGQQWTEDKENRIDLYFPVFTTLQFFFYMGWLKVAESLINPFGEDDDDFEVNWMVDRNLQVSYLIVDEMHHEHPQLIKDQYWDEVFPNELPYTIASEKFREEHPEPSTAKIEVSKVAAMPTTLSSVRIDEMVGKSSSKPNINQPQPQQQQAMQTVNYKFPDLSPEEEADDASGIHFTAGNGKARPGSSPSLVSLTGTLSRVNTVASALKRFLSRDESRPGSLTPSDEVQKNRFLGSASSASLVGAGIGKMAPAGLRITDQVIEEVDDEQATITSQRANDTNRPNVRNIFNHGIFESNSIPERSEPIDIPTRTTPYTRAQSTRDDATTSLFPPGGVESLLSSSAPAGNPNMIKTTVVSDSTKSLFENGHTARESRETVKDTDVNSTNNLNAPENVPQMPIEGDDFDKLKAAREKERQERQKLKLARTISTAPAEVIAQSIISAPAMTSMTPDIAQLNTESLSAVPSTSQFVVTEPVSTKTSKSLDGLNQSTQT